jgi:hypothetical protein
MPTTDTDRGLVCLSFGSSTIFDVGRTHCTVKWVTVMHIVKTGAGWTFSPVRHPLSLSILNESRPVVNTCDNEAHPHPSDRRGRLLCLNTGKSTGPQPQPHPIATTTREGDVPALPRDANCKPSHTDDNELRGPQQTMPRLPAFGPPCRSAARQTDLRYTSLEGPIGIDSACFESIRPAGGRATGSERCCPRRRLAGANPAQKFSSCTRDGFGEPDLDDLRVRERID